VTGPGHNTGVQISGANIDAFLFSTPPRPGSGVHLTSCSMGTGDFSPRTKRPGRETVNSLPSAAEVTNV
jgi:hypothetical protein